MELIVKLHPTSRILTALFSLTLAICNYATAETAKKVQKTLNTKVAMIAGEDNTTPDLTDSTIFDYQCELNDSLTLYTHKIDDSRAAIRWKNKLYGLRRVATTTGANRFENKKAGLVWIGIPTKGMLMDSKRGQQLANECITGGR